MSQSFSLQQLLDFAVSRERESAALYNALAKKAKRKSLKLLFEKLATQELDHEKFYTKLMRELVPNASKHEIEENEFSVYMRSVLEEHSASFEVTSEHIYSLAQALDFAIAREKNAILFYTGLKNYIPTTAKPALDLIIQEEMRHAAILVKVKLDESGGH
jgi:rubrerythrin